MPLERAARGLTGLVWSGLVLSAVSIPLVVHAAGEEPYFVFRVSDFVENVVAGVLLCGLFVAWAVACVRYAMHAPRALRTLFATACMLWTVINLFYLGTMIHGYKQDLSNPFFHNNAFFLSSEIESAVFFYIDPNGFGASQAAKDMVPRFGTPIAFSTDEGNAIGRFLRALNVAFNLDLAKQRLNAALTLFNRFGGTRADLQISLMQLADTELNDALTVLSHAPVQPFYPVSVDQIGTARSEIAAAIASPVSSRGGHISNAVSRVEGARDPIGANINYDLGSGNLMF